METQYIEERVITGSKKTHLAADIAHHLRARQHLGKTIVICEKPVNLMSSVRKQWLKYARQLQSERAGTVNTEKILRLTAAVTHMHQMRFTAKSPHEQSQAHVYFIRPEMTDTLPDKLYNVYVTTLPSHVHMTEITKQLPEGSLVIDYTQKLSQLSPKFQPKQKLEEAVNDAWQEVVDFMKSHHIDTAKVISAGMTSHVHFDEALDTLLNVSDTFLTVASEFQHTLELAQPIHLDLAKQRQYDILILLAHRVQALSPNPSQYRFTTSLNDETFFLHDIFFEAYDFDELLQQAARRQQYQYTDLFQPRPTLATS